jgi:uncharacterized membrane protein
VIVIVLYLILLGVIVTLFVAPLVLSLVAFVRSRRIHELTSRVQRLEALVREIRPGQPEPRPAHAPGPAAASEPALAPAPGDLAAATGRSRLPEAWVAPPAAPGPEPTVSPFDWESFIGRKALGWVAVVLVVFATAFFIRYAFENDWIGPTGRVALAAAAGLALVVAGWHYDQHRGWRLFAQMLTSAGVVLSYLAVYSAFGFYHLLPKHSAAPFLLIVVVESMVLAVQYDAPALALVAVLGGLVTPVLMQSGTDQYTAFFLYLAILDAGVVILALRRPWPVVTTLALVGTQFLFWNWYEANYHPEKRGAALAFQSVVFFLFLGQGLVAPVHRGRVARWEELGRWLLNAFFGFLGFSILLKDDYPIAMGALALVFAALYAELARRLLTARPDDDRLFLTSLAIAVGFVAAAFPVQAHGPWIALGWMAEAWALWWFGLRVGQVPLRGLAVVLALMAIVRVVSSDTWEHPPSPYLPIFNEHALPAIGASACLLAAVGTTRRLQKHLTPIERNLIAAAEVVGIAQLWLVLSADLYNDCRSLFGTGADGDDRFAQMALSVLWAVYATAVLAVGFRLDIARLRWTALGLYGVTVAKVFLFDMAGLDEIFRILAFLVLAVLLGIAAGVYQRIRPGRDQSGLGAGHVEV